MGLGFAVVVTRVQMMASSSCALVSVLLWVKMYVMVLGPLVFDLS
jgi:hypothetical protein